MLDLKVKAALFGRDSDPLFGYLVMSLCIQLVCSFDGLADSAMT